MTLACQQIVGLPAHRSGMRWLVSLMERGA
jgi:hypothetical protein